jgi:hypothetical protein
MKKANVLSWFLLLLPMAAWPQACLEQFPFRKQTDFFDFRYMRDSPQIDGIAHFSDGFVRTVNQEFFSGRLSCGVHVLVLEDRPQYKEFVAQKLDIRNPYDFGICVPPRNLIATYPGAGLGTFSHLIASALVESNLTDRPMWAKEGIPTFFEKFYGYWKDDELVVYWGFQNPWRISQIGSNLTHLDLNEIISGPKFFRNSDWPERTESNLRMAAVFLWEKGRFNRFLRLVATRDKAGYPTYFEAAMGMPLEKVLPMWQEYLQDVDQQRARIMSLPLSTICDTQAEFRKFSATYGLSLEQPKQSE